MKRCARCVLTDSTPNIAFDADGVCSYCHAHKRIQYQGEPAFRGMLEKHRKPEGHYDCVCAISGGRDSTFVLLKLVRDYGMRVLAVNYANPFTVPEARRNVENATKKLGVDLMTIDTRQDRHRKVFVHNFRAWCRKPSLACLPMMCAACKNFWPEVVRAARANGVSLIVGGMNRFEDTAYKKALLGVPPDEAWENTFIKALGGVVREVTANPAYLRPDFWPVYLKTYLFGDPYAWGARHLQKDITLLDMFFYLEWNEEEIVSRLRQELDWTSPADYPSTWRFDCELAHIKDLVYLTTIGVTEKDDFYSKMVRDGLLTREQALARLEKENQVYEKATRKMAELAGVRYDDLVKTLEAYAREYRDRACSGG